MKTFFSWRPKDSILEALLAPGQLRTNTTAQTQGIHRSSAHLEQIRLWRNGKTSHFFPG